MKKINDNPFIIDFINFEKNIKNNLDLKIKGTLEKNTLRLNQVTLSENENILLIKDLTLSNDYKIEEIRNIKLSFKDKTQQINELELKKDKKNLKLTIQHRVKLQVYQTHHQVYQVLTLIQRQVVT